LKDFMVSRGFDEVMNYSFLPNGKVELMNSLSEDKKYLRESLVRGLIHSSETASLRRELLNLKEAKIFEIGNVHKPEEELSFSFLIETTERKQKDESNRIREIVNEIKNILSLEIKGGEVKENIFEGDLTKAIQNAPEPEDYSLIKKSIISKEKFTQISPYPYITRDIAFWASGETTEEGAVDFVESNLDSEWVRRVDIFDIYPKDGKISYAIRVVFQADDKTLSDEEVNVVMDKVYKAVEDKGWETR